MKSLRLRLLRGALQALLRLAKLLNHAVATRLAWLTSQDSHWPDPRADTYGPRHTPKFADFIELRTDAHRPQVPHFSPGEQMGVKKVTN